ncbi:hypothetical protein [Persicobacter psychrovividus]|uniref:Uncharacterized protein n=1 Tax=Persicobacter psychrovividus TaxID=387638 RepID=A0ABN6LC57_9BACT|nr:hypothetical protein PEPS_12620 [Persicobacter psychrovividus]
MSKVLKNLDPKAVEALKADLAASGLNHQVIDEGDNNEEMVNFRFVGEHEGEEVIFDVMMSTLRLEHAGELYEVAEKEVLKRFPKLPRNSEEWDLKPEQLEEVEEVLAEVMMEAEAEGTVKVKEHVELDYNADLDTEIFMDVALNLSSIDNEVISEFVDAYKEGSVELDDKMYSFVHEGDDD